MMRGEAVEIQLILIHHSRGIVHDVRLFAARYNGQWYLVQAVDYGLHCACRCGLYADDDGLYAAAIATEPGRPILVADDVDIKECNEDQVYEIRRRYAA